MKKISPAKNSAEMNRIVMVVMEMQQDQEGMQDESGASDVPADPSGIDGVQGLNEPVIQEEPKPKQTRALKPKKSLNNLRECLRALPKRGKNGRERT